MSGRAEMIARLGLDDRAFARGMKNAERRSDDFAKRFKRSMDVANKAVQLGGIAAAAGIGLAVKAVEKFAEKNRDAAAGVRDVRTQVDGLIADIGRDLVGGGNVLGAIADGIDQVRRARDRLTSALARPFNSGVDEAAGQLRAQQELDRRLRASEFERQTLTPVLAELATSPEAKRAAAIRAASDKARARLKAVAANTDLTGGERARLIELISRARDQEFHRIERADFGQRDGQINALKDQIRQQQRVAAVFADPAKREQAERNLVELTLQLKRLVGRRDILSNRSLTDAQVREQLADLRQETSNEKRIALARIDAEAEARARARIEQQKQTVRGVRDEIVSNRIAALGLEGKDVHARRLALALSFMQSRERINDQAGLTDSQRDALLKSNRALFELAFEAIKPQRQQHTLGAGLGALAGQTFVSPASQAVDIQKSIDRTLKEVNTKMDNLDGGWK